jgi:hypothetical protein
MTQTSTAIRRARWLLISAGVVVLLVFAGVLIDRGTQPKLVSGPMVQIPEPGTLTIVWSMDATFPRGAVRLHGEDGSDRVGLAQAQPPRYEATFRGLATGKKFRYTVVNYGFLGREIRLTGPFDVAAPPPRGRPFRFLAFGDSGVGGNSQSALAEVMVAQKPDLIIHAGDLNQFDGAATDYPAVFFAPYAALIRSIPFMPVLGNHDYATESGKPLLDCFVLPENGPVAAWRERNFYFDFGDVRFVGLDTNKLQKKWMGLITPEEMRTIVAAWLRGVLTNCDARWKIVYYHQPFYTGSKHGAEGAADVKEAYVRVFEECGVDTVFSGHNHLYELTAPLHNDKIVGEGQGVVYITTGAGGAPRYPEGQPVLEYIRAYRDDMFSFTLVDVTPDRLTIKQIGENGEKIDEFTIGKPPAKP